MEIITGTLDFKIDKKSVVTIGKFDGIHRGHLLILDTMWNYKQKGFKSVVITFDTSPQVALGMRNREQLTTTQEKRLVMDAAGVDVLIEFPFNEETAKISAEDFIKDILVDKLNVGRIVVGDDCTFGYKALGTPELLTELGDKYGYETDVIEKLKYNGQVISATYLRELVAKGEVEAVKEMSRQPYFVYGSSYKTGGLGHKFGFPYCVFEIAEDKVMPLSGLYYTKIYYDDVFYPSLSFVDADKRIVESYLFDASREIGYDNISVGFFKYVREPLVEDGSELEHQKVREQFKTEIVAAKNWHRENIYIPEDVCLRQ